MAGKRARASEDLRSDSGREKTPGIKPGLLQSLFGGGPARQTATMDTRMGRSDGVQPSARKMLFAGGAARSLASEDIRMGAPGEGADKPHNLQMLDEGGEAGGDEYKIAAEDVMDAFKVGKPEKLARALQAFFRLCESEPHDEAPSGDEG